MEAADEIQKETIIKDDDVTLGNGDVSSSADLSLEEPSPGFIHKTAPKMRWVVAYLILLVFWFF